jgi:hypothetical protein
MFVLGMLFCVYIGAVACAPDSVCGFIMFCFQQAFFRISM